MINDINGSILILKYALDEHVDSTQVRYSRRGRSVVVVVVRRGVIEQGFVFVLDQFEEEQGLNAFEADRPQSRKPEEELRESAHFVRLLFGSTVSVESCIYFFSQLFNHESDVRVQVTSVRVKQYNCSQATKLCQILWGGEKKSLHWHHQQKIINYFLVCKKNIRSTLTTN